MKSLKNDLGEKYYHIKNISLLTENEKILISLLVLFWHFIVGIITKIHAFINITDYIVFLCVRIKRLALGAEIEFWDWYMQRECNQ